MSLAPVLTRPPVGSPVAFCKHVRERASGSSSSTLTAWISSTGDVASRHGAIVQEAVGGHCCVSAVGDLASMGHPTSPRHSNGCILSADCTVEAHGSWNRGRLRQLHWAKVPVNLRGGGDNGCGPLFSIATSLWTLTQERPLTSLPMCRATCRRPAPVLSLDGEHDRCQGPRGGG